MITDTVAGPSPVVHGSPVLSIRDVAHRFGDVPALAGVDLDVAAGEVVGLLGPNGAGKTTLVRVVATLLVPDAGEVRVAGLDPVVDPAGVRAHLGLAGQLASVDDVLTGRENLELVGRLYGIDGRVCRDRAGELLDALGLAGAADRRVSGYSGGMRRRLDLGATLIGEPDLLLLDEPTTGLDPRSRIELWSLIDDIADRGTAVLVTSQYLEEVERLADRVVVLAEGRVIADAHPQALQREIGGQVVDVAVPVPAADDALARAVHALAGADLDTRVDRGRGRVTATTTGGLPAAAGAARRLVDAGVEVESFALRVPSLEEAFLALTGETAPAPETDATSAPGDATHSPDGGALPVRRRPALTRSLARDVAVVVGRDLRRLARSPESLFFASVQPVLFVLGLAAVFGDLVEATLGQDYVQFLLPGLLVMQGALAAGATGVGLATDLRDGIVDRFRSLPMAPVAVLVGRTTADLLRNTLALGVMVVAGFAIGFRLDGGVGGGLAAFAVAAVFGYALTWVFACVGLAVRDPQAANFVGFAPVLLFVYLSSAWVPIETMDGAVQGFARNQPVNVTIEAARALASGAGTTNQLWWSLAWSAALLVVFGTLATRQFARTTS